MSLVSPYRRLCQCTMIIKPPFSSQIISFHKHTKHVEIDCYVVHDRVLVGLISSPHIGISGQLADIFTKGLSMTL